MIQYDTTIACLILPWLWECTSIHFALHCIGTHVFITTFFFRRWTLPVHTSLAGLDWKLRYSFFRMTWRETLHLLAGWIYTIIYYICTQISPALLRWAEFTSRRICAVFACHCLPLKRPIDWLIRGINEFMNECRSQPIGHVRYYWQLHLVSLRTLGGIAQSC